MNYLKLGKELKRAREAAGFTQRQIAETLNVTAQTLSAWENGKNKIDIDTFTELCQIYGIDFVVTLNMLRENSIESKESECLLQTHDSLIVPYKSKEKIATMLKRARSEAHISVNDVAVFLDQFGINVSPKTIYGWETARSQPDIDTFLHLCKCYNVQPDAFINFDGDIISDCDKKANLPSPEALCVAHFYDKGTQKERDAVRLILGMTEVVDSPRTEDEREKELA